MIDQNFSIMKVQKLIYFLFCSLISFNSISQTMNTASSTTGIAPFAVFFDAIEPNSNVVQPKTIDGRKEYADLYYSWDFGEPGIGNWPESNKSKNKDIGYIASHIYETPGNYTVTLNVKNSEGETFTYTEEITVLDPDVEFAGENTICISSSGNFTGAPSGALQVSTTNIKDIENYIGNHKRILLRRGDSWTTSEQISVRYIDGPFHLGAFGEGINPDERGIFENAPVINATGSYTSAFIGYKFTNNVVVSDLHLNGEITIGSAFGGATELSNILHNRLHVEGFRVCGSTSHYQSDGHDRFVIANSHCHNAYGNIIYVGSERLVLLGNLLHNASLSHVVRVWQGYKAVIAHNILHGSSIDSDTGRLALKFHGPEEDLIYSTGDNHLNEKSGYSVIYDNIFGTSGPWPVVIGPQNEQKEEHINDILVEANRFLAGYGSFSLYSQRVSTALRVNANYVTIRNNIFDATDSGKDYQAILIHASPVVPSSNNRIYNNTVYKNDFAEPGFFRFSKIDEGCVNTSFKNNLQVKGSNSPQQFPFLVDNGENTIEDNNLQLDDDDCFTDPDNINLLDRDFHLTEESDPIDAGISVPIFHDFDLIERPKGSTIDVGAFEFDQVATSIPKIDNKGDDFKFQIYPNPTAGKFSIDLRDNSESLQIEIYNSVGKLVYTKKHTKQNKIEIDITSLPKGVYLIKLNSGISSVTKQILKI